MSKREFDFASDESKAEALNSQKRQMEDNFKKRIQEMQSTIETGERDYHIKINEANDTIEQLNKKLLLSQKQLAIYRDRQSGITPSENQHELRSLRELSADQSEQIAVSFANLKLISLVSNLTCFISVLMYFCI